MTLQTSLNTPILATGSATASIVIGGESGSGGSGSSSTAVGYNTTALGDGSVAMGLNATTSGAGSIVIGTGAAVPSSNSIAIGPTATASGNESVAIGVGGNALGDFSTVIGIHSNAGTSGQQNIWTLGHNATNTTPGSMLLGGNTGSTPLKLIWNDQTADLGTVANTFGTLYTDNIVPTLRIRNSNFTPIAGAAYFINSVLSPLIITLPTTPNVGDTYFMTTTTSSYKIQTQTSGTVQVIYYNNAPYDNDITTSTVGATISIICLQFTPGSPSSSIFVVTSTSPGAVFTGT